MVAWGQSVTVALNFAVLAFIISIMVRKINGMKKAAPPAPALTGEDIPLLRGIRDGPRK